MERTVRLFDVYPAESRFEAQVISCEAREDGKYSIILDKTLFFPEEGGQSSDTGSIGGAKVEYVFEKEGVISHIIDEPLSVGASVSGEIDFDERFRKMQNHTAEHIVSGLIFKNFGFHNVGFHLSRDEMTADFDGELNAEQIKFIETEANKAIFECHAVRGYYPDAEELAGLEYRSKLDITENVRIVEIEGVDKCACCAPHVAYTGEVGQIKLLDFARYKGGVRIHMLCGMDALADYHARYMATAAISAKLTAPQKELVEAVDRLSAELQEKKAQIARLQLSLAEELLRTLPTGDAPALFFEDRLDTPARRALINGAVEKRPLAALFAGDDEKGYAFLMGSQSIDLRPFSKTMTATLGGKGGGSTTMVQGTLSTTRAKIEEYFN